MSRNFTHLLLFSVAPIILAAITAAAGNFQDAGATPAQARPPSRGDGERSAPAGKRTRKIPTGPEANLSNKSPDSASTTSTSSASSSTEASNAMKETEKLPEVLDPSRFYGMAQFGYAAAKAAPAVMAKIFCYCGCDLTDNHHSLLDCFTSLHGVDCHYCQEEAVLALKMHKEGRNIAEIQKTIDLEYERKYPFDVPTETFKKYKATRLWQPDKPGATAELESSQQAADAQRKPKLKPGAEVGACCGNKEEHGDHKRTQKKGK